MLIFQILAWIYDFEYQSSRNPIWRAEKTVPIHLIGQSYFTLNDWIQFDQVMVNLLDGCLSTHVDPFVFKAETKFPRDKKIKVL